MRRELGVDRDADRQRQAGERPAAPKESSRAVRPVSLPCSQMRRATILPSGVSYWARTSQWSRTGGPSAEAVSPTRVRTVAASGSGSRAIPSHALSSRCSSAHSSSSRAGQPGPDAGMEPNSRTREASPGAWASTMRAAVSSQSPYPG